LKSRKARFFNQDVASRALLNVDNKFDHTDQVDYCIRTIIVPSALADAGKPVVADMCSVDEKAVGKKVAR